MRLVFIVLYSLAHAVMANGFLVVIDPGHGGKDPGAIGVDHILEKDITLSLAQKLKQKLIQMKDVSVVLTREKDVYLTLSERRRKAEQLGADLLVSIHADSFHHNEANGMSVYALSSKGATSFAAEYLASQENTSISSSHQDDDIDDVLLDLQQASSIKRSIGIGEDLLHAMGRVGSLHSDHVEQAAFVVLKSPKHPSVLIESGFISNKADAKHLNNKHFQEKLAESMAKGIKTYLDELAKHTLYTVVTGDSLYTIALNQHTTISALKSLNHLKNNTIFPGMKLRLH